MKFASYCHLSIWLVMLSAMLELAKHRVHAFVEVSTILAFVPVVGILLTSFMLTTYPRVLLPECSGHNIKDSFPCDSSLMAIYFDFARPPRLFNAGFCVKDTSYWCMHKM